jgi:hypothetical protein
MPANDTLEAPASSVPAETDEFDFAALDPANLMKQAIGEQVEIPGRREEPSTPVTTPDPTAPTPTSTPTPTPTSTPEPVRPAEGVNMRKLRELREAAERERDQYKAEREELARKLADLEPRAKQFETESERLARELEERQTALQEAQAQAWRVSAREKPEWKEKATAIHTAAAEVQKIMEMPEIKEAGLSHSVATLLDPSARSALNDVIRVLNEAGRYAEAQEVIDSHRAVNAWRGELRRIEESAAAEATTWQTKRDEAAGTVVREVRAQLASANPVHDTRSPEFLALPKEQQDFLLAQHAAAEQAAREVLSRTTRPQELVGETYKNQLALRLFQQANTGLGTQLAAAQKEVADLKARLEMYEKAAGGSAVGGGGGAPRTPDFEDPAELAKYLDPKNLQGYNGLGR